MAKLTTIRDSGTFKAKAAQCPSCFTFNHPEYLPEQKKQTRDSGLLLTCAVCGTPYQHTTPKAA